MAELFQLRHETGDFSEYDVSSDPLNLTQVTLDAGLAGSLFGMQLDFDGTFNSGRHGKAIASLVGAPGFGVRIHVNPGDTVALGPTDFITILQVEDSANNALVELLCFDNPMKIRARMIDDNSSVANFTDQVLIAGDNYIEIQVTSPTSKPAANGAWAWWVNTDRSGPPTQQFSPKDIWDKFNDINELEVGRGGGSSAATGTSMFIDEMVFRNDLSAIGPHVEPVQQLPPISQGKVQAQPTIFLNLVKSVDTPGIQDPVDVTGLARISGACRFSGADAANVVNIEAEVKGVWGIVAVVEPGASAESGAFDITGRFDRIRAEVKGLGAGVNCTCFANGAIK